MKDILSVGFNLPSNEDNFISLNSNNSLSDADIVIFSPNFDIANFSNSYRNSTYRGKTSYELDASSNIKESARHWNLELKGFLESGKNLYIFLCPKHDFYLDTGQRRTSGTGRNQKVTNMVDLFNNYKFLPFELKINNAKGKKMVTQNDLIKPFFKAFEKELSFEAYIEPNEKYSELIKTKSLDKLLSVQFTELKGNVIVLPFLETDNSEFYDKKENWNENGIKFGKKIIHTIIEIDKILSSSIEKTPKPEWINLDKFKIKAAESTKILIKENLEVIKKLENKNENLIEVLTSQEVLKDLLFETGQSLEVAVIKALEILGYKAENYDDGVLELDQVITSPENFRFIGECEGKDNKDIDIHKFRQLSDSLSEDFARETVDEMAYGILFGNPHRLQPIEKRKSFFTEKCIRGAEREKIALVKTIDLFFIVKYLSENKNDEFQKKCRNSIINGLGKIVDFPKIPEK